MNNPGQKTHQNLTRFFTPGPGPRTGKDYTKLYTTAPAIVRKISDSAYVSALRIAISSFIPSVYVVSPSTGGNRFSYPYSGGLRRYLNGVIGRGANLQPRGTQTAKSPHRPMQPLLRVVWLSPREFQRARVGFMRRVQALESQADAVGLQLAWFQGSTSIRAAAPPRRAAGGPAQRGADSGPCA